MTPPHPCSPMSDAAQAVARAIDAAFAGVTLGEGIGLEEAQGLDDYADEATGGAARARDDDADWNRITPEQLNRSHSSLSFFDAEGMRFHLPAYLLADLRGEYHFGMVFCLTHLSDHNRSQFERLTPEQRAAVRAFLHLALDDPDDEFDRPEIVRALDGYWKHDATP